MSRRRALQVLAGSMTAAQMKPLLAANAPEADPAMLVIDPEPRFTLSPYLYMQFMEPLGVTDSSVAAAWDHVRDRWRPDVVQVTRELAPTMIRWGGIFTDYYRWREGVGPRDRRVPMLNLCWGGIESNQVGTVEFVDFCRRVGAEPLIAVNFESDGRPEYRQAKGQVRTADAREAAEWVAYCNQPDNEERRAHGHASPLQVRFWQLGNETSYSRHGFDKETAAQKTVEFAKAMRAADPSIQLIGWGDSGWARRMIEVAGEHVQFLAFHHMFNPDHPRHPVLRGELYRRDPAATWEQLMNAWQLHDAKIRRIRESLGNHPKPLALTECHFAIPGRHRCDVLSTWTAGVAYARLLNVHQRHGELLRIATAADFCGTRWQTNAVMIPVPDGQSYLMPVARVMQLYRRHCGTHAVRVVHAPEGLDVVASRHGHRLFVHVVNTQRTQSVRAHFLLSPRQAVKWKGRAFEIADDPMVEVSQLNSGQVMQVKEKPWAEDGVWTFPPASVTALDLEWET